MEDAAVTSAVRSADAARAAGRLDEARTILDRTLATAPRDSSVMQSRLSLAREEDDAACSAMLCRRLAPLAANDDDRLELLCTAAAEALNAAAEAIEKAVWLSHVPRNLLEKLKAVKIAAGRWEEAVDVTVAIAEHTTSPAERAQTLVSAAQMCANHVGNTPRAVALYEAAMADDPEVTGAFEAIETVLLFAEDFEGLESAYLRQLERLAERGADVAELTLLRKLATLREEHTHDRAGAIASLDRLLTRRPSDVEARTRLAALLEEGGEKDLALRCYEIAAEHDPAQLSTFRSLFRIAGDVGDLDRSYAAASVLVHYGEANEAEQAIYQRYAPHTALSVARGLEEGMWEQLFPPDQDHDLRRLVRTLAPAACAARLEQMRASKTVPLVDAQDRQDPERTTLTAVRAIAWASRFLGAPLPEIHVRNAEVAGGLVGMPVGGNVILVGKSMLSGRAIPELTFAAARELAFRGATSHLLTYFPSVQELRAALLAGMSIVLPSLPTPPELTAFREAMASRLDPSSREALAMAVRNVASHGPQIDVVGWLRGIETMSCRAGLLATGDLTAAARMLAMDGRKLAGISGADRIRDLITFNVSDRYANLRRSLGVALADDAPLSSARDRFARA